MASAWLIEGHDNGWFVEALERSGRSGVSASVIGLTDWPPAFGSTIIIEFGGRVGLGELGAFFASVVGLSGLEGFEKWGSISFLLRQRRAPRLRVV